jgi:polyphosphate kinase
LITLKINSLVDAGIINALYKASQAGTRIDLIVRGICCLRPGIPGLSENIHVRSIVGRYLEHSRLFRFGSRGSERHYYLGSADLMPRNLDRRVEALAPILDPDLQFRIDAILDVLLADDVLAWELDAEGNWQRLAPTEGIDSHVTLQDLAITRSKVIGT